MLVPMLVLALAGAFFFQKVVNALNEAEEEVRLELLPVVELQDLLHRAAMPANDYLLHGNPIELENFARFKEKIDAAFNSLPMEDFGEEEERSALTRARGHWDLAKVQGQELLDFNYPLGNRRTAMAKMENFDATIDKATSELGLLYTAAAKELGKQVGLVDNIESNLRVSIAISFVIAIVVALIGGIVLKRTILMPIQKLDDSVVKLREGHFDHRVTVTTDDEFGRLGETLNEMAKTIERVATRDELTGLYVRREFNRFLRDEIVRAKRSDRAFSLLMVDADRFKDINDNYGHPVGDQVLRTLARILRRDMRAIDRVARIGGEEFAVIMPDTGADAALETAERIRSMTEQKPALTADGESVDITISVGVATYPEDGNLPETLIAAADWALYQAKRAGRNCVRQAEESAKKHPRQNTG